MLDSARNPDGTYDGTKALSIASGGRLSPGDVSSIWEEVKANKAALDSCPGPHHVVDRIGERPPFKFRCQRCGGTLREIVPYINGFVAAGGKGSDVWSEWTD